MTAARNVDVEDVARFEARAHDWWDPDGPLRTLHAVNPLRLRYIDAATGLSGRRVLDVGCGGGLLTEAMARAGAHVTGLDASPGAIAAACAHRDAGRLSIEYHTGTIEEFAGQSAQRFDLVTCMELLEHVPDPETLLRSCAGLLKPGGHLVVSTINRTARAYVAVIVAGEYLFHLLPRGTHEYARFIRPSELAAWLRASGLDVIDVCGIRYLPWLNRCSLSADPSVNYLVHARLGS
jgi:2-polyprenyl-6-hydroxyphenyl methylase/3-demethylubiquinone-9 3-methyltransferase